MPFNRLIGTPFAYDKHQQIVFPDPQLMEKLQQVRRRHALALVPTPDIANQIADEPANDYPLVGSYMSKWKEAGKTPAAFLSAKPPTTIHPHQTSASTVLPMVLTTNQATDSAKNWKPVSENPVSIILGVCKNLLHDKRHLLIFDITLLGESSAPNNNYNFLTQLF